MRRLIRPTLAALLVAAVACSAMAQVAAPSKVLRMARTGPFESLDPPFSTNSTIVVEVRLAEGRTQVADGEFFA